jgi:predicted enzyme related to lactoylglutathione lyase
LSVNKIGHSHIAITVDDISHVVNRIIQLGGSLINLPAISPDGLVSACYCRDPEGNILEIVEVQS